LRDPDSHLAGQAVDLTNCDREPIHILGHVQSFGCLVAVSADWIIAHVSTNCSELLGLHADDMIGAPFSEFFPADTIHTLRTRIQTLANENALARMFTYPVFDDDRSFDVSIHTSGHMTVFEFEPRNTDGGPDRDDPALVQALLARVTRYETVERMAREAARGLKLLSGFDRVMVYRFEEDDTGTVIAEAANPGMEPFQGLRYPASDIPKQARALYCRSLLRLIADVNDTVHPIYPDETPSGDRLDLSLSVTRAVSPIHLEYLRNMGVGASMSVSILRQGKLWGLFACHHNTPRYINFEKRSAVELFGQLFNYELAQTEMNEELAQADRSRALHDRLMVKISSGLELSSALDAIASDIEDVVPFDGIAVYSNGHYTAQGSAPTEEEFLGLARYLNTTQVGQVYATDHIAARYAKGNDFIERAAGLLALPISRQPRDYIVLFRRELVQTVAWAGNPDKPVEVGPNGVRLTPRKSFESWQEIVRGKSAPWTASERRAADTLRVTLLEVVLKLADETNAARKRAQEQQELLIAELNHRVRNILNLIRSLVAQGRGDAASLDAYCEVLDARIHALARAHDQLTGTKWGWISIRSLIDNEVRAFLTDKASRVSVAGDDAGLSPSAFTCMALVVHELVTNSVKYGALSNATGSVDLTLSRDDAGRLAMSWQERNGPPVSAPQRRGFGTTIIERSVPFELKGQADLRYKMTGLEADFVIPETHVRQGAVSAEEEEADDMLSNETVQLEGAALVVEDNLIIAMDASDMLADLGATPVQTASRVSDALRELDTHDIKFALLDVNLGEETSLPVAKACVDRGITVILATGYGADEALIEDLPNVPVLQKPYTADQVKSAIARALRKTSA
jgi:light-regulated signal transduction histidine kinase (bacteriophytochrome)